MTTCATLIEMYNKDMERAALQDNTESFWSAIQKDLGESFLGQKSFAVDDGSKENPADDDVSGAQKHDDCSSKLPLNPVVLKPESPVQKAVRETELLLSALNVTTTKQDKLGVLLTGNGVPGKTKMRDSQESPVVARIHPLRNLKTENERKLLGNYPVGYNQRTPEHLHSLFGVKTCTDNQNVTTYKPRLKKNVRALVPIILGSYPKDYNIRTKEHLHFLFGAKSQTQMKDEEKVKKDTKKERKNKGKKIHKQKKAQNKAKEGHETLNTSTSFNSEPTKTQTLLAFLRIPFGRNKTH